MTNEIKLGDLVVLLLCTPSLDRTGYGYELEGSVSYISPHQVFTDIYTTDPNVLLLPPEIAAYVYAAKVGDICVYNVRINGCAIGKIERLD